MDKRKENKRQFINILYINELYIIQHLTIV